MVFPETRRFEGDWNEVRKTAADYAIERIVFHHQRLLDGVTS